MGKSALLYRLMRDLAASGVICEVINGDAIQHYCGLDIGSNKPSRCVRARYRHHLIDVLKPSDSYSVVQFCTQATKITADIVARGRVPVVCGGSVYFILHLLRGLPTTPPPNFRLRAQLQQEAADDDRADAGGALPQQRKQTAADNQYAGTERLHRQLTRIDPVAGERIHPHDRIRIIRALEIYHASKGVPPSHFSRFSGAPSPFYHLCIPLVAPQPVLRTRIVNRLAHMYHDGLIDEVRALAEQGYSPAMPGLRAIGYRQFFRNDNTLRPLHIPEERARINDDIISATAHYAKKQLKFLRQLPAKRHYQLSEYLTILQTVRTFIRSCSTQSRRNDYYESRYVIRPRVRS